MELHMDPYNPIARIREEADPQAVTTALELCLQFFMASTIEDFRSIILRISTMQKQMQDPIDPLEFLYRTLSSESYERILFLKVAELWGEGKFQAQAIDIEPIRWRVSLKNGEDYIEVEAEKDPNYHVYENPAFVVKPENGNTETVVIDILKEFENYA